MILVTLVVVSLVATTTVVAVVAALLAMLYVLVRRHRPGHAHLRFRRLRGVRAGAQAARPVPVDLADLARPPIDIALRRMGSSASPGGR